MTNRAKLIIAAGIFSLFLIFFLTDAWNSKSFETQGTVSSNWVKTDTRYTEEYGYVTEFTHMLEIEVPEFGTFDTSVSPRNHGRFPVGAKVKVKVTEGRFSGFYYYTLLGAARNGN